MMRKLFNRGHVDYVAKALCLSGMLLGSASFAQTDPFSSNNGMFPTPDEYNKGFFNASNLDYPKELPASMWDPRNDFKAPLDQDTAEAYMAAVKKLIEPDMRTLVENHEAWNAKAAGWYNMVWRGAGQPGKPENPISGREVIMNTNTGQIVPNVSWAENYRPTPDFTQNYGVIYYNESAAYTLGQVFNDVNEPDPSKMEFPDGSIVVKIEAATVQPDEWPWTDDGSPPSVLHRAASWKVYRPTTENQKAYQLAKEKHEPLPVLTNVVQTVYPFQLAIKIKDSNAAPETGWVYMGFVYDAGSDGETAWDRFVPAGLMWGNDPEYATTFAGTPPEGESLKQTWVNDNAPPFVKDTMGWGGRFAAPMDVAVRHNIRIPLTGNDEPPGDGFRVSSCLSCHGAAQFPFEDNLYPSPDNSFPPPDGDEPFHLYLPGSPDWQRWFQNRAGSESMSAGSVALDYDLSSTIAFMIWRTQKEGGDSFENRLLGIMNGH
ncbi:MAG: hypothetical protein ABJ327_09260 [Litoreibacter sp.]